MTKEQIKAGERISGKGGSLHVNCQARVQEEARFLLNLKKWMGFHE